MPSGSFFSFHFQSKLMHCIVYVSGFRVDRHGKFIKLNYHHYHHHHWICWSQHCRTVISNRSHSESFHSCVCNRLNALESRPISIEKLSLSLSLRYGSDRHQCNWLEWFWLNQLEQILSIIIITYESLLQIQLMNHSRALRLISFYFENLYG